MLQEREERAKSNSGVRTRLIYDSDRFQEISSPTVTDLGKAAKRIALTRLIYARVRFRKSAHPHEMYEESEQSAGGLGIIALTRLIHAWGRFQESS